MPIKLVCFDLDGTIIENIEYIWQVMHDYFNVDMKKRKQAKDDFFAGKMSYDKWAHHDVGLWIDKGATKETILKAISHVKMINGARETLQALKDKGIKLAVVSGSIDVALEAVLPDYDELFDDVYLTRLIFDKEGKLTYCIPTKHDYEHKATALKEIAEKERIALKDTMFVGDHDNDVDIAKVAGFSIAFNSNSKELNKVCDIVIEEKNLKEILKHIH